jgi:hypothetical protein
MDEYDSGMDVVPEPNRPTYQIPQTSRMSRPVVIPFLPFQPWARVSRVFS